MPFHDGAYYPYTGDTQGTHSSAGIPSLLNSPLSQPSANGHAMTPSSSAALPFKFRPRRESVDWRRINAVDVELVVSQLDVDALQEHIAAVTFCSLDGERCQRCQSPVDPALVKLLRLAQLSVEWLLHCQEFLSINLRAAEERLAAAGREREQLLAEQRKQEERVKALGAELKQRKKVIRTQQSLLAPRIISSQKCLHCEKSFLNSSFLQNHMQRRHPDQYQAQLQADGEKKSQVDGLKLEISSLKEQVAQQQQALQDKMVQEKEQQSLHKELLRELERFRLEEMARMERKIEDSRDGMRREMEFLYSRNIQALNEVNQNQSSNQKQPASPASSQPERDVDVYTEKYLQSIQRLEQQMKRQDKKWESRLQDINYQHESEKNQLRSELSRMQASVLEHGDCSQRLLQMERRLQEKEQTIRTQREQMKSISSSPPIKAVEVPAAASAPVQEPKQRKVILDSSSVSERRPAEKKPRTGALKKNGDVKKETRPNMEQAVAKKLESLGVRSDQSGLKKAELGSALARAQAQRESVAKTMPDYWRRREEMVVAVEDKLGGPRGSDPGPEPQSRSKQAFQIRPRSSSLPSRASQAAPVPPARQSKTPQPAPRTKASSQPKTSTPSSKTSVRVTNKTPPFSSDDSEEEDTEDEEEPRFNQAAPVQIRAHRPGPGLSRQAAVRQLPASDTVGRGDAVTAVTKMESDEDDWSDISELQEIDLKQQPGHKDLNGNVEKRSYGKENKMTDLVRKLETQLSEPAGKRPAGGVSILAERKDEVQDLLYTDLEDSSEWAVSSLEDRQDVSKPASVRGSGPLRKSLDSSTSVWGTSTGKGPRSGLTGAGTGSSLKSSLLSLGDISDSEDINSKYI